MIKIDINEIRKILAIILLIVVSLTFNQLAAQTRIQSLETRLNSLIADIPTLDERINISVNDVTIQEYVRGISNNSNINIFIDPNIKARITTNYNQVRVLDILVFLCKEYNLDINVTGSILSIISYAEPVTEKPKPIKREPKIEYNSSADLLTMDLVNDSLALVVRKLTDVSQKNVIISPDISSMLISSYIKNINFDAALEKVAYTNKLTITKTKDNFYILEKEGSGKGRDAAGKSNMSSESNREQESDLGSVSIQFHSPTNFSVNCERVSIEGLLRLISDTLGMSYTIVDKIEGSTEINMGNVDYEEFLNRMFMDGSYGFQTQKGFYIIGKNENPLLKTSRVIKLQHRTVEKIMEIVPEDIVGKLMVKEFTEQNSLIVIGNPYQIKKFELFINEIDQVVPLVLIELMIVEVNKTRTVATGIYAGIDPNHVPGKKEISPGIDYEVSTQTINSVLAKMTSFGWINFGKVSPNFYLNVKALEDDGKIIIRSTPKLATLNGHEASLSSGETKYYKEERSNFIGTQNPTLSNSYTWTSIKADLSVTIKPIVSGNEQITLDITVDQSQFTPREYENSPPGSVTRKFKSLIRMKNQEMVLLGGLDKFSTNSTSKGIPLLARIPVLKWIFGSNTRTKGDTKLNLFIQPTIIY